MFGRCRWLGAVFETAPLLTTHGEDVNVCERALVEARIVLCRTRAGDRSASGLHKKPSAIGCQRLRDETARR